MADVDFAKLLSKKVDDCKPPPLLPSGTYRAIIQKYDFHTSREKGTPFLRLHLQFIGAEDDVDPTELAEVDLSKVQKFANFFLTESSDYRLANFLKSLGVKTAGRSINEASAEIINATVLVPISQRLDKNDPSKAYNDVGEVTGA